MPAFVISMPHRTGPQIHSSINPEDYSLYIRKSCFGFVKMVNSYPSTLFSDIALCSKFLFHRRGPDANLGFPRLQHYHTSSLMPEQVFILRFQYSRPESFTRRKTLAIVQPGSSFGNQWLKLVRFCLQCVWRVAIFQGCSSGRNWLSVLCERFYRTWGHLETQQIEGFLQQRDPSFIREYSRILAMLPILASSQPSISSVGSETPKEYQTTTIRKFSSSQLGTCSCKLQKLQTKWNPVKRHEKSSSICWLWVSSSPPILIDPLKYTSSYSWKDTMKPTKA